MGRILFCRTFYVGSLDVQRENNDDYDYYDNEHEKCEEIEH